MPSETTPARLIVKMLIMIVVLTVAMIPMAMSDRRYPLVTNYYYRGFIGVVLAAMLVSTAVYVFKNRVRLRSMHKNMTQNGDNKTREHATITLLESLVHASIPITIGMVLLGGATWVNTAFDHSTTPRIFTVTDSFALVRHGREEQYVALEVPAAMGLNRVWSMNIYGDFRSYPIGRKIEAVSHDGFLGFSWCEYRDPTFQNPPTGLSFQTRGGGKVESAHGFFTPNSPSRRELASWGIPVTEK